MEPLTSNYHHTDGENLLVVGLGCNVTEANAGHAGHREVERCNVHCRSFRSTIEFDASGHIVGPQMEWQLRGQTQPNNKKERSHALITSNNTSKKYDVAQSSSL